MIAKTPRACTEKWNYHWKKMLGNKTMTMVLNTVYCRYQSTRADSGIFQRRVPQLILVFKWEGHSTIYFGFQRGTPPSKCIISTLF
jgi:hypothetical protein